MNLAERFSLSAMNDGTGKDLYMYVLYKLLETPFWLRINDSALWVAARNSICI
jgi:hypothetical protein